MFKKLLSVLLSIILFTQLVACGFIDKASEVVDSARDTAINAKDAVVEWYEGLDFSKFKAGWDAAVDWMGSAYTAVVSVDYLQAVQNEINILGNDLNAAYGSLRGTAQEAGFAAEKWVAGTFNIDSVARGSKYKANVVGSHELGSADVSTNYGEEASLKYYNKGSASAQAQAKTLIKAYHEYAQGKSNPTSLQDYMDKHGYDYETQSQLLPLYDGQTRIIPTDQMPEATAYLQGRINKLSTLPGPEAEQLTATYQQTLDSLRDRITAPDGTSSKPMSYEEMQAIAELSQNGEFKPEDFGITVSQVIPAKYVLKQAIGTGLEAGTIKLVLTIGPDVYSIIVEAIKSGCIDENKVKETGIAGVIAMSEGFVEGSVARIVIDACQRGLLGEALKSASPNVIGALVYLTIEALISGYSLAKGEITPEEYGSLMADRIMVTAIAIPITAVFLLLLPGTKLFTLIGCLAGGLVASGGYTMLKEAFLEFVDGGGFEAIIPAGVGDTIEILKQDISGLNISEQLSNLKEFVVSTTNDGYVLIKGLINQNG